MTNTQRELEIQEIARDTVNEFISRLEEDLPKLRSVMELAYYHKQLFDRVEILNSMKFDLQEERSHE